MKTKLTPRDKVLLYLLVMVIIVFVGFRYFINPAKEKLASLTETESTTQMEYDITRITAGRVSSLETSKSSLSSELEKLREDMYAPMYKSEDIEWLMDRFIDGAGLTCSSMTIRPTQPDTLHPFGQADGAGISADSVARVEMLLDGSVGAHMQLVEALRQDKYISVSSFNISSEGSEAQMNLVLELLMY